MDSLMRFGRKGCAAVMQHYEAWKKARIELSGKKRKEELWQIQYARAAERSWFQTDDALHLELQDIWKNRIANKEPVRGCIRKVVSMVRMSPSGIRLRRKKEWFCEARRHAAKCVRSTALVDSEHNREVGDRGELVLFSSPENTHEIDKLLEQYFEEASKCFTNNRTKDQAGILVAYIRCRGHCPIRTSQVLKWLSSKKNKNKNKRKISQRMLGGILHKVRKRGRSRKRSSAVCSRVAQKGKKKQNSPVSSGKKESIVLPIRPASQPTCQSPESSTDLAMVQATNLCENSPDKPHKSENRTKVFKKKKITRTSRKEKIPASQPTGISPTIDLTTKPRKKRPKKQNLAKIVKKKENTRTHRKQTSPATTATSSSITASTSNSNHCFSEQWAATVLGYTQASWDNKSGREQQPSSSEKYWVQLTARERAAAAALGYTEWKWDKGGKSHEPASANKHWTALTACAGKFKPRPRSATQPPPIARKSKPRRKDATQPPPIEAEAQVSKDEERAAGMLGNNKMPMSNGEDSLASEIIPPFDQQHDWSMQEDLMQPLAGSLDLLLGLDFSDLSRLTAVPPPLSPPAMNRLFSSGGDDPGNMPTCFWSDDDFGK